MKKRLLLLIFVFLLSVLINLSSVNATEYSIYNWTDLQNMKNHLSDNCYLENDLNSSTPGYSSYQTGAGFEPIGNLQAPDYDEFTGTFDGQNHTITGLFINNNSLDYVGLFGYTDSGVVIKDVGLVAINITGDDKVGGLVGQNKGTISNSYSTGSVNGADMYVGGLVGKNDGTISNANSTGDVSGTDNYVGGLVGQNQGTISNSSYSTGSVSGDHYVGGLVGAHETGTISNSYSTGSVNGGTWDIGGLVGYKYSGTISNSYSTGNVTSSGDKVGGLVGYNRYGTITNSYSTGNVSGTSQVGGLVGNNTGTCSNSTNFWNNETSSQSTSACGTGKTTAQMKTKSTFTGWSFCPGGTPWAIDDGSTYPCLNWQYGGCRCHVAGVPTLNTTYFNGSESTNMSAVTDYADVANFILHRTGKGKIKWLSNVDVGDVDIDTSVKIGTDFVSVNSSALSALNVSANVTIEGVTCPVSIISYASGFFTTKAEIQANGEDCEKAGICSNKQCIGTTLTFTVSHFTGYAAEGNANLTIYDEFEDTSTTTGTDITFYANYTNATSGIHIASATCNIYFDDDTSGTMTENPNVNYYYTKSGGFSTDATHKWNVTCDKAGYTKLTANDTVVVTAVAAPIPEFSTITALLALVIVISGFLVMRKRD